MPSSSTPAVCTTAVSGCSVGHGVQEPAQCLAVGDVAGGDGRPRRRVRRVRRAVRRRPGPRGPAGWPAAGGGRRVGDQMPGEQRAEPAGAAGDQDRALRIERERGTVSTTLPMWRAWLRYRKRLRRSAHVPGRHRQGPQRAPLEEVQECGQHLPDPLGPGFPQVERPVAHALVRGRDLLRVTDVGLAHLQEPTAARQQPQRGVHELPRQGVQHHIHTPATGRLQERPLEVQLTRGGDMRLVQTRATQRLPLPGLAVPNTSAPRCRANCTAAMPTPPAAACTSTDSPACTSPRSTSA